VRLNNTDYGLHLNVETMDDVALKRACGDFDDPQHLYEGPAGVNLAPGSAGLYEVDEGDEEELSDIEALIVAANLTSPEFSERMAPVADLAEMTREWAVERYIAHWDGYSGQNNNNHFLYSDPNGVFQVLPWGPTRPSIATGIRLTERAGRCSSSAWPSRPAPPSTGQPSSRSTNLLRRMI
jgi:spore coat protein CotH